MHDIRGDCKRASSVLRAINAHDAGFEKHSELLKSKYDSRLEDLNAELEGVARLDGVGASPVQQRARGAHGANPRTRATCGA